MPLVFVTQAEQGMGGHVGYGGVTVHDGDGGVRTGQLTLEIDKQSPIDKKPLAHGGLGRGPGETKTLVSGRKQTVDPGVRFSSNRSFGVSHDQTQAEVKNESPVIPGSIQGNLIIAMGDLEALDLRRPVGQIELVVGHLKFPGPVIGPAPQAYGIIRRPGKWSGVVPRVEFYIRLTGLADSKRCGEIVGGTTQNFKSPGGFSRHGPAGQHYYGGNER